MAFSPRPALPGQESPLNAPLAHQVEVVGGAPSTEMLEAEIRGDIILIEDIYRRTIPPTGLERDSVGV